MKKWTNAEVVELNIKSTAQDGKGTDGDNFVPGTTPVPGQTITTGLDYDASGASTSVTVND